jgi:hypothetical protein
MSWFRDKFNLPKYEIINKEIPFSTITRWSLYDLSVDYPNEISVLLGLNPVSAEGESKEIQDSEDRLEQLDDLVPFIDIISELNAKIIVAVQMRDMKKDGLIEGDEFGLEELEHMTEFYKAIGFSAIVTAFSSGIELDIIQPLVIDTWDAYKEEDNGK